MVIMASTDMDATKPQSLEAGTGAGDALKSEANGHTSPSTDSPNGTVSKSNEEEKDAPSKTTVNGSAAADEQKTVNGDTPKDTSAASPSKVNDADSKADAKPSADAQPAESEKTTKEDAPLASEDVEMADADAEPPKESSEPSKPEDKSEKPAEKEFVPDAEATAKASAEPEAKATDDTKDKADEAKADETKPADSKTDESKADESTKKEASADAVVADKDESSAVKAETNAEKTADVDTEMTDKPSEETSTPAVTASNADAPSSSDAAALPTSEVDLHPESLSQLALESEKSPVEPSTDVSMTDAPNVKIAREREEDAAGDEPAPKRARTEPREDEPATSQPSTDKVEGADAAEETVEAVSAPGVPPSLTSIAKWDDKEINGKVFSNWQRREIRKFIAKIKKSKLGANFRDSVQNLWPALWDGYVAKVEKPMDLAVIDRTLRDDRYPTVADFKKDLSLIYENSLAFNGAAHDVTHSAFRAVQATWAEALLFPTDPEPSKSKPAAKPKPARESRVVSSNEVQQQQRRQSQAASPAVAPAAAAPEVKTATPAVQEPAASLRRTSTADGDRPKRTVRAPKPKDIDYTKPSRKKLKPELQFCDEVLTELMASKHERINRWFMDKVDAEGLGIPNYYNVIKKPMDMGKVSRMMASGDISNLKDFDKNMRLILNNCYLFNGPPDQGNPVSGLAKELEDLYNSLMKGRDAWLAKHAKANAPPASNGSDDEEEDEDDEGEDTAAPAVDPSKEVRELEAKLREESMKLTDLFAADAPNQSMIQIQQGILNVVQDALLKAKQSLADYRQKHDKPSKKAGKPTKPKSSSGASGRKSSNAAPPKKSGVKKSGKKNLTAADKDSIANAINDLDYPHLDRAIEIIKRDTGQAVSGTLVYRLSLFLFLSFSSPCFFPSANVMCRKTARESWSSRLISSATRPCLSCGTFARRCCQDLARTPTQVTHRPRCSEARTSRPVRPSNRLRRLASRRRTSP
jgi:bromodomain-containing factor 1